MSIGQGGPFDREMSRWSAAGMAQILDQNPEADFSEARVNLRLYQSGAGRYSLGRYAADCRRAFARPGANPARLKESTTPQDAFSAPFTVAADLHTRSSSRSACGRHSRRFPESSRIT